MNNIAILQVLYGIENPKYFQKFDERKIIYGVVSLFHNVFVYMNKVINGKNKALP